MIVMSFGYKIGINFWRMVAFLASNNEEPMCHLEAARPSYLSSPNDNSCELVRQILSLSWRH